jgi:hypothetical protein
MLFYQTNFSLVVRNWIGTMAIVLRGTAGALWA